MGLITQTPLAAVAQAPQLTTAEGHKVVGTMAVLRAGKLPGSKRHLV